jgi:putative salt-induced outer membrane protein
MIMTRLRLPLLLTVLAIVAAPAIATAQATPPPPPRHEVTADLAFVGVTGNTSTSTLSTGAQYIARPTNWLVKNTFLAIRGEEDGALTVESVLYAFRSERTLNKRTSAFAEYGFFHDDFSGISSRNQVTGGLAFKLATGPTHTFSVDGGLGYLNEQRLEGENISSGTYSGGASYIWKMSENATLTDDFRALSTFDDSGNWRVGNSVALTAKLTSILALKVSNIIRHSNFPPPTFLKTDTTTSIALVVSFKKQ